MDGKNDQPGNPELNISKIFNDSFAWLGRIFLPGYEDSLKTEFIRRLEALPKVGDSEERARKALSGPILSAMARMNRGDIPGPLSREQMKNLISHLRSVQAGWAFGVPEDARDQWLDLLVDAIFRGEETMMNPKYHFARMRELLDEFQPSRERSLAATKLDECEMWLEKCTPADEARMRDMTPGSLDQLVQDRLRPAGNENPAHAAEEDLA